MGVPYFVNVAGVLGHGFVRGVRRLQKAPPSIDGAPSSIKKRLLSIDGAPGSIKKRVLSIDSRVLLEALTANAS